MDLLRSYFSVLGDIQFCGVNLTILWSITREILRPNLNKFCTVMFVVVSTWVSPEKQTTRMEHRTATCFMMISYKSPPRFIKITPGVTFIKNENENKNFLRLSRINFKNEVNRCQTHRLRFSYPQRTKMTFS